MARTCPSGFEDFLSSQTNLDETQSDLAVKPQSDLAVKPLPEFEPDYILEQRIIWRVQNRIKMKRISSANALPQTQKVVESGYNSESEKVSPVSSGSRSKLPDFAANSPEDNPEGASSLRFSSPESAILAIGSLPESPESGKPDESGERVRARPRPRSIFDISLKNSGVKKRVSFKIYNFVKFHFKSKHAILP